MIPRRAATILKVGRRAVKWVFGTCLFLLGLLALVLGILLTARELGFAVEWINSMVERLKELTGS